MYRLTTRPRPAESAQETPNKRNASKIAMVKGNKKPKQPLTERINVRVTAEEYEMFEMASELDGRSLSNWARRTLMLAAQREIGQGNAPSENSTASSPHPAPNPHHLDDRSIRR